MKETSINFHKHELEIILAMIEWRCQDISEAKLEKEVKAPFVIRDKIKGALKSFDITPEQIFRGENI